MPSYQLLGDAFLCLLKPKTDYRSSWKGCGFTTKGCQWARERNCRRLVPPRKMSAQQRLGVALCGPKHDLHIFCLPTTGLIFASYTANAGEMKPKIRPESSSGTHSYMSASNNVWCFLGPSLGSGQFHLFHERMDSSFLRPESVQTNKQGAIQVALPAVPGEGLQIGWTPSCIYSNYIY